MMRKSHISPCQGTQRMDLKHSLAPACRNSDQTSAPYRGRVRNCPSRPAEDGLRERQGTIDLIGLNEHIQIAPSPSWIPLDAVSNGVVDALLVPSLCNDFKKRNSIQRDV